MPYKNNIKSIKNDRGLTYIWETGQPVISSFLKKVIFNNVNLLVKLDNRDISGL